MCATFTVDRITTDSQIDVTERTGRAAACSHQPKEQGKNE
jgi:hypothetical protein